MRLTEDDIFKHFQAGNESPYFKGHVLPQVRGRGLGAIFASLVRKALPIAKKVILPAVKKHVLPQAKKFAIHTTADVLAGKNLKQSLKNRGKVAGKNILASTLGAKRRAKKGRKYITKRKDIFS